jgi:outer membrane protein W
MAESFAFANRGVIIADGVTLGVVKDVDISWSAEHMPLYGWGSIQRQAVAKHSQKVAIKIGWVKFDPVVTANWLNKILTGGATMTGLTVDTNVVKTFTITARFTTELGTNLLGTITEVYFPDFPLKATEGQWVKIDMNGEGKDIAWTNP